MNDKLHAFLKTQPLPASVPPLEDISRDDLILAAFIICYQAGMSSETAVDTVHALGVQPDESRKALLRGQKLGASFFARFTAHGRT